MTRRLLLYYRPTYWGHVVGLESRDERCSGLPIVPRYLPTSNN